MGAGCVPCPSSLAQFSCKSIVPTWTYTALWSRPFLYLFCRRQLPLHRSHKWRLSLWLRLHFTTCWCHILISLDTSLASKNRSYVWAGACGRGSISGSDFMQEFFSALPSSFMRMQMRTAIFQFCYSPAWVARHNGNEARSKRPDGRIKTCLDEDFLRFAILNA